MYTFENKDVLIGGCVYLRVILVFRVAVWNQDLDAVLDVRHDPHSDLHLRCRESPENEMLLALTPQRLAIS